MNARVWAIVPAAGVGRRMGGEIPKQYLELAGARVIDHALGALLDHPRIARLVVTLAAGDPWWPRTRHAGDPRVEVVPGGAERAHSVANALEALAVRAAPDDWVLVHDAARPCLCVGDIDRLLAEVAEHPAGGLLAVPVADTLKRADAGGDVAATVDRSALWRAFTPQAFRFAPLQRALDEAIAEGVPPTDEAAAMERAGWRPRLVQGRPDNIKLTHPGDLALAEFFLTRRGRRPC